MCRKASRQVDRQQAASSKQASRQADCVSGWTGRVKRVGWVVTCESCQGCRGEEKAELEQSSWDRDSVGTTGTGATGLGLAWDWPNWDWDWIIGLDHWTGSLATHARPHARTPTRTPFPVPRPSASQSARLNLPSVSRLSAAPVQCQSSASPVPVPCQSRASPSRPVRASPVLPCSALFCLQVASCKLQPPPETTLPSVSRPSPSTTALYSFAG